LNPELLSDEQAESAAQAVEAHPDFRVLRRLQSVASFGQSGGQALVKGVIVDTETTGLNQDADRIIEIGVVVFEYDPLTGQAFRVLETYGALEDPGFAITPEITAITGINNDMVAGQRIDDERVAALVEGAALVIAHNSRFDRPFLEQRFPVFETLPWGCSLDQVDWAGEGLGARKLDYIAAQFGFFFDAHRAEADCMALLHILQQTLPKSNVLVMKSLLDQLPLKDWTVYAVNARFETKDSLKARAYRWDGGRKTWHRTLTGTAPITSEVAWLKEMIYDGREVALTFEVRDALLRYSRRPGKQVVKTV
jgi:DNA polymerase-3 subunit epsilon